MQSEVPLESQEGALEPLDVAASAAELADRLRPCLQELDRLQLWRAGAYLSLAVAILEGDY